MLQAIGIAYKRLGRPEDALQHYQSRSRSSGARREARHGRPASSEIAQIQETLGQPQDAVKSYNEALELQREIGDKSGISIDAHQPRRAAERNLGRPDEALPLLREALRDRAR